MIATTSRQLLFAKLKFPGIAIVTHDILKAVSFSCNGNFGLYERHRVDFGEKWKSTSCAENETRMMRTLDCSRFPPLVSM
mmetsp:Transcript_9375/g.11674  ORF Transcript_9375/g.11674 Transcript_9375/m.11674 type:complete len:80 (-) Transcript_9375:252-491(-)